MNIANLLIQNIEKFGEYPFLDFGETTYTNLDIHNQSNRLAKGLLQFGAQKDDRILVMLPNTPEVLISYQAILKIGCIVVPVNYSLTSDEVQYIIEHCEPKLVITNEEISEKIKTAMERSEVKCTILLTDGNDDDANLLEKLIQENKPIEEIAERSKDDVATIIYTSGTTGNPKGAMITHGNVYFDSRNGAEALGLMSSKGENLAGDDFSILVVLPISHIYGLTVTIMSYLLKAKLVLLSRFVPDEILQLIESKQIKMFSGVPTMYQFMASHSGDRKYNVSSVKLWLSGASALSKETRRAFEGQFDVTIIEGYGLTESTSSFSVQHADRPIKENSVGQALPNVEVNVFDSAGNILESGTIGELAIKGPNVMKGYYRMEKETAEVLKDGWLLTGDIGYIDEDGDIFIVERKNDLIIRGGFNIYPSEVEEVLLEHPSVSDVGVIGIPDLEFGETVKAFVVLKPEQDVSKQALIEFCEGKLATYKIPENIEFIEELPKNDLGKILRKELRTLS